MKDIRVLVTGGAGFIGSNIANSLFDEGHDVTIVDDLSNGHIEFLNKKIKNEKILIRDFVSQDVLKLIQKKSFDVVIHLAALPRVSYSVDFPIKTHDVNVTRSLKLIDSCVRNVHKFIFASSSSVYGGTLGGYAQVETDRKNPQSPYALQKSIIEDYLKLYSTTYGLRSIAFRFFNVFGQHQVAGGPYATALSSWLNAIKRGEPMRSDGDGTQTRDLCHVDNVTKACRLALYMDNNKMNEIYNVATGDRVSNQEILDFFLKRYPGSSYYSVPERPGDVKHTLADISLIEKDLYYTPAILHWDGIKSMCDWYDTNWEFISSLKGGILYENVRRFYFSISRYY